eukprot:TRINITY_DN33718_c0_g2_i1.p1 TRINITY_DN33718_c0_g2~~TRINITY_DN33718_c0_g2_i1.p1  ORF type:complete len:243 (-),score=50.63 TRINITY_DN33718_c0_g2_i1:24-752(-)
MPPRRPGGKYKGLVGRSKTEGDLAEEARLKAQKAQEEILRKAQLRKEKEMKEKGMKVIEEDPEEVRKAKILAMMMGGKNGNMNKFFRAWIIGTAMRRRERGIRERETAWRTNCGAHDHRYPGGCSSCAKLGPSSFAMTLDNFLAADSKADALRRDGGRTYMGTLKNIMSPSKSVGFLPEISKESRDDWLKSGSEVMRVSHYKNGKKRYLLDTGTMRISHVKDDMDSTSRSTMRSTAVAKSVL